MMDNVSTTGDLIGAMPTKAPRARVYLCALGFGVELRDAFGRLRGSIEGPSLGFWSAKYRAQRAADRYNRALGV